MKKLIKFLSLFVVVAIIFASCASNSGNSGSKMKEPEKTYDLVVQVINMSSHPLEVWPRIVTKSSNPVQYDREVVFEGEKFSFYLNSSDLVNDFENWKKNTKNDVDITEAWLTCGYKQLDTKKEYITCCMGFSKLKDYILTMYIEDDSEKKLGTRYSLLSETTVTTDLNYTMVNNSEKPVYVANTIVDENGNRLAVSEVQLLNPGKSYKYNYSLDALKKQFPGCRLGIMAYEQYNPNAGVVGWNVPFTAINNDITFTIADFKDSNANYLKFTPDTTTEDWSESKWTSFGDDYFKTVADSKSIKFTEKSDKNDIRIYTNYATDKCRGFEAEVVKYSGDEVGSGGYGFTINENLEKGTGYILFVTTVGIYKIFEMTPNGLKSLIETTVDGNTRYFGISYDLNHQYGVKDKITVLNAGKDIKIYFNDNLEYVINNAKYLSGNTRLVASHNGNSSETTEIDYNYLKFQK